MGKSVKDDPSKSTRWAWAKQTPDGVLSSGNLSADKVKHAWQLMNGNDSRHRITMDKDGARKGRTMMEAPGGMTLKLGQDLSREPTNPFPELTGDAFRELGNNTLSIQVENGNLNLDIQNGDLNVRARNINFEIADENEEGGNFSVKTNGKIVMDAKEVLVTGVTLIDITSNNVLRCLGTEKSEFLGGITKLLTNSTRGANAIKPDLYETEADIPATNDKPYDGPKQKERKGGIPLHWIDV